MLLVLSSKFQVLSSELLKSPFGYWSLELGCWQFQPPPLSLRLSSRRTLRQTSLSLPLIYIHFGAPVCLSYIVTPLAAPPPIVSFWVSTLCAVILPPSSIFHKPPSPEILLTFNNEKPFTFKSLFKDTVSAVISAKLPVPPLAASCGWPRLTKTRTIPVWEKVAAPSESVVQPSNGSKAMPTVGCPELVEVATYFIPTPAKTDEIVILSPIAIGPFSREILTGTRPDKAIG